MREHAERLTIHEITDRLKALDGKPRWVTLSGGNPALMQFDRRDNDLLRSLRVAHFKVTVETQGSVWRDWLGHVDHLTVSPKPPSSGMTKPHHLIQLRQFLEIAEAEIEQDSRRSMKIVVFDDDDYVWARELLGLRPKWQAFLSVGTPPIQVWGSPDVSKGVSDRAVREQVCERYAWLAEKVANDWTMGSVRVLPQLHVLSWGHARGV